MSTTTNAQVNIKTNSASSSKNETHEWFEDFFEGDDDDSWWKRIYTQARLKSDLPLSECLFDYFVHTLNKHKIDTCSFIQNKTEMCHQITGIIVAKKENDKFDEMILSQQKIITNSVSKAKSKTISQNRKTKIKH